MSKRTLSSSAFAFVVAIGILNLFGDVTYEGGASINGPFLGSLGASAAAIAIAAGAAEFLGYALRPLSGRLADRTGALWTLTAVGYAVNLFAVPAMALAGAWPAAAALVLAERVGRAIRKPTVETMLSYTTGKLGAGWVFGLATALDETGATLGPLLVAFALARTGNATRTVYAWLLAPALLALVSLGVARALFPKPERLEGASHERGARFPRAYRITMGAGALFAAGLVSFELISYHLARTGTFSPHVLPLLLALATGVGVIANLVLGKAYDRFGIAVVVAAVAASSAFAPLVFLGGRTAVVGGMLLWGIGYATQDTLLKALVAGLLPEGRRSYGFGLFYAGYGVGWLLGSIATGLLYEPSRAALSVFCVGAQLASIPVFFVAWRARSKSER